MSGLRFMAVLWGLLVAYYPLGGDGTALEMKRNIAALALTPVFLLNFIVAEI